MKYLCLLVFSLAVFTAPGGILAKSKSKSHKSSHKGSDKTTAKKDTGTETGNTKKAVTAPKTHRCRLPNGSVDHNMSQQQCTQAGGKWTKM